MVVSNTGTFDINGGTVNVAGRLEVSGGTVDISGGTVNLNTVGNNSSTKGTLDLSLSADWNMTAGTLNFKNPSGAYDIIILNSSGHKNFNGTINLEGSSSTYKVTSQIPFPNLNVANNANLILEMLISSNGTYNFPLINGSGNTIPASITLNSGTINTGASIQIETNPSKLPENKSSANYLNRYWTITTGGITDPNYDVTVNYTSSDIAGTESAIAAGLWTGSLPWQKGNAASSNSITFSGITTTSAIITGITQAPPTVEINGGNASETICNGTAVTLTAVATGDPTLSFSWNPSTDLTASDVAAPDASPASTTIYEVTVTDGNGFTATDDIDVIVDPVSVGGTVSADQTICSGDSPVNLSLSGNTGTIQWQSSPDNSTWTNISGATAATLTSAEMGALVSTTYYRAEVTSGVCPPAVSTTATVTVNPLPTLTAAAQNVNICDGNPATINLSGLLPNTTFTVDYTIDGSAQAAVTGLTADASGNSSFNTGNLTSANNNQTLQITGITITSATPNCPETFTVNVTLSVDTPPSFTACPASAINLNTDAGVCTTTATYTVTADGTPAPTLTYEFTGATTGTGSGTGSGSVFNVGTTDVTVTATNSCGTVVCNFSVNVSDNEAPVINCPGDVSINTGAVRATCDQVAPGPTPLPLITVLRVPVLPGLPPIHPEALFQ